MNWSFGAAVTQEPVAEIGQQPDISSPQMTAEEGDSATPKVGMKFKNAEEAFSFYHDYAISTGFGVKCQYSKYDKEGRCRCIVISCNRDGIVKYKTESHSSELTKKTNCMAKIHLGYRDDGFLHVKQLIVEHNHPLFPVEIPSKYVLERWRKDYKRMLALSCFPDDVMVDGQLERHESFYRCCLKLSEIGLMSDEKYEFGIKVVNEAMQKLLAEDSSFETVQHKNLSCNVAQNSSLVTFTLNNDAYTGNGDDRTANFAHVGQAVNHSHYEFFQERVGNNWLRQSNS
ncbi:Protein FAR1-RELATED SEQUENCE 2 [Ananas comosus]|uniref:Protein FAR1-RELATED SEQUENCE n=1 Tax=Ananas comosus TaxID=4615 RepID=A0A199UHK0_ANACO|nr:Protein FAR1-RELATED SEQUENCE 2 [Ananas comosus]